MCIEEKFLKTKLVEKVFDMRKEKNSARPKVYISSPEQIIAILLNTGYTYQQNKRFVKEKCC
jgi:hypothetical protein